MSAPLLDRLRSHRAQMAPHQLDRPGGKLIVEALAEIERLTAENARLRAGPAESKDLTAPSEMPIEGMITAARMARAIRRSYE